MTEPADQGVQTAAPSEPATTPMARPSRMARVGRGLTKTANWFVPIATTREAVAETKQSMHRIGGSFRVLWRMIATSWARAKAAQATPDAASLDAATDALLAMPGSVRTSVMRGARLMWAFGVAMMAVGVVLFTMTLTGSSFGVVATMVYGMASLGWAGFGVAFALRSASDYHAVDQRRPCTGWTVLRTPALWVPLSMGSDP